jgi:hypothetical protein
MTTYTGRIMSTVRRALLFLCSLFLSVPSPAEATPIQWAVSSGGNGHYYEAVDRQFVAFSWTSANADANSRTFAGLQGHLATLTSAAETAFVVATFPQAASAFGYVIGGFQLPGSPEPGGGWQWVTGESFIYTNWISGEPNNAGGTEDIIHLRDGVGHWNDLSSGPGGNGLWGPGSSSYGYLIEYSFPVAQTPEPVSMALLGLGVAMLWAGRRSYRRREMGSPVRTARRQGHGQS